MPTGSPAGGAFIAVPGTHQPPVFVPLCPGPWPASPADRGHPLLPPATSCSGKRIERHGDTNWQERLDGIADTAAQAFISSCMAPPEQRPGAHELLEDPFLQPPRKQQPVAQAGSADAELLSRCKSEAERQSSLVRGGRGIAGPHAGAAGCCGAGGVGSAGRAWSRSSRADPALQPSFLIGKYGKSVPSPCQSSPAVIRRGVAARRARALSARQR